jgi:hypothetical protein
MRKLFLLLIILVGDLSLSAQVSSKVRNVGKFEQGQNITFDASLTDTLKSNDTVSYVFQISHANEVDLIIDQRNKLVAADTAITLNFMESSDGITYTPVLAGSSPSAYTKSILKSAPANVTYICDSDICWFSEKYLKLMYISKTKAGFKKILSGNLRTNIR